MAHKRQSAWLAMGLIVAGPRLTHVPALAWSSQNGVVSCAPGFSAPSWVGSRSRGSTAGRVSSVRRDAARSRQLNGKAGSESDAKQQILILGGGVIGISIAYHLALRGVSVKVVDRAGIASCASGKAGGFLARTWNDGSPLQAFTRKSFDMHEEVAEQLGLPSYRRLKCKSVAVDGSGKKPSGAKLKGLEWTDLGVKGSGLLGDESTIAQVLPKQLIDAMWDFAVSKGSTFQKGFVQEIKVKANSAGSEARLAGVVIDGKLQKADVAVLCMGPWGAVAQKLLPGLSMRGVKYHSVVMRTGRVLNEAVFFSGMGDPEVYPRNDGDTYVTGFPDLPVEVNEAPGDVEVREKTCTDLIECMTAVSSEMQGADVTLKQSCYLPITNDGYPCMGKVPGVENAYIATGHGCWGILNSLATGLGMSELIVDGRATSVDLSPFGADRFMPWEDDF